MTGTGAASAMTYGNHGSAIGFRNAFLAVVLAACALAVAPAAASAASMFSPVSGATITTISNGGGGTTTSIHVSAPRAVVSTPDLDERSGDSLVITADVPNPTLLIEVQGGLVAEIDGAKQAARQLVEQLVQRGYVTREPDTRDRRAHRLALTERGWACTRAAEQRPATRPQPGSGSSARRG